MALESDLGEVMIADGGAAIDGVMVAAIGLNYISELHYRRERRFFASEGKNQKFLRRRIIRRKPNDTVGLLIGKLDARGKGVMKTSFCC